MFRVAIWLKARDPSFPCTGLDLLRSSNCDKLWSNMSTREPATLWSPPPFSALKWNTDGSAFGKPGPAGIGGVLRNHRGEFLCFFSCPVGSLDSNYAEILALSKALHLSTSNESLLHTSIIFELDSANTVSWVLNSSTRPWKYSNTFNTIQKLISRLHFPLFVHTPRTANSIADSLAKTGVSRSGDFIAWMI